MWGLTIRSYFAVQLMAARRANSDITQYVSSIAASKAVEDADALIKALEI